MSARQSLSGLPPADADRTAAGTRGTTSPGGSSPAAGGPAARIEPHLRRGRGSGTNASGRYERFRLESFDDGWESLAELPGVKTQVTTETPRKIITRNQSPDISFDRSINPYRGCEHGCSYCFARPTHAYMGLSPGLDFETKLFAKPNAAELLETELAAEGYEPRTIAMGTNTDPYQPIERTHRITRKVLQVLARHNHPVGIVTKNHLVTRDIDILGPMAEKGLAKVALSITTMDRELARNMEPRASTPQRRLEAILRLTEAGIPTTVMVAPVIPGLNDSEIESILAAASAAGAREAGYVMLRLPLEVRDLFVDWLNCNVPDRAGKVMSLVRQMRGGKDYDADFGSRMRGTGPVAWSIGRRFEIATDRNKMNRERVSLRTDLFEKPLKRGAQLALF
ncbi:PA0069 family radical SAM protein [Tepidamorphus sp. 3E244]|uniref:PA0069 family radical SAM protein n=1 Tax=Tepidamorphus sp. 3E244 TaxID=3385498 RepID=UPI0038FC72DC